jgi:hypothetical protein
VEVAKVFFFWGKIYNNPFVQVFKKMNSCLTQLLTQGYNSHELHKKSAWILSIILPSFVFVSGLISIIVYWKY